MSSNGELRNTYLSNIFVQKLLIYQDISNENDHNSFKVHNPQQIYNKFGPMCILEDIMTIAMVMEITFICKYPIFYIHLKDYFLY